MDGGDKGKAMEGRVVRQVRVNTSYLQVVFISDFHRLSYWILIAKDGIGQRARDQDGTWIIQCRATALDHFQGHHFGKLRICEPAGPGQLFSPRCNDYPGGEIEGGDLAEFGTISVAKLFCQGIWFDVHGIYSRRQRLVFHYLGDMAVVLMVGIER